MDITERDELLSIVSHELRSPITALALQLEMLDRLLERGAPLDDLRERTGNAKAMLERLSEIVERLRDVTRTG